MALSKEEKERRKQERNKIKWEKEHLIINGIIHKWCNHKNHWVQMDDEHFYKNDKNSIDGYSTKCIPCDIERAKKNAKLHPDRVEKGWRKQNENASLERILYKRGTANKSRELGQQKAWRQRNPIRVRELAKNHRDHDISSTEEKSLLEVFGYKCAYCGMSLTEHKIKYGEKLHKDHVDHDGYNDLRNAVPACKSCNCSKWQFTMDDWYQQQEFFSEDYYNKIIWWISEGYLLYIEEKLPYRFKMSRVYNEDGTWNMQHELWTVDEKRNMMECIGVGKKKEDLKSIIINEFNI